MYDNVLGSGKIGHHCCQKLIQMGEACNNELASSLEQFDKYKNVKMVIKTKSLRIFNQCEMKIGIVSNKKQVLLFYLHDLECIIKNLCILSFE